MIYSNLIMFVVVVDIVPSGLMTFFYIQSKSKKEKLLSLRFSFFGTKKTRHIHRQNQKQAGRQRGLLVDDKSLIQTQLTCNVRFNCLKNGILEAFNISIRRSKGRRSEQGLLVLMARCQRKSTQR